MSTANGGAYCSKMAQTFTMVNLTEAPVNDAAVGGSGAGRWRLQRAKEVCGSVWLLGDGRSE